MSDYYKNTKKIAFPATPVLNKLTPADCPKYPNCGSQLCAFDSSWKEFKNYQSSDKCTLISEAQKAGAESWVNSFYPEGLLADIRKIIPAMKRLHPHVFITSEDVPEAVSTPTQAEGKTLQLTPASCDRYEGCSAMVCPLDAHWRKVQHIKGERVCKYLTDSVKEGAGALFRGTGRGELFDLIQDVMPEVLEAHAPIRKAVERAKQTGYRLRYTQEAAA